MPRRIRTSRLERCAIVVPKRALARMSLKSIIDKTSPSHQRAVESAFFDDVEQAKAWLRSPSATP